MSINNKQERTSAYVLKSDSQCRLKKKYSRSVIFRTRVTKPFGADYRGGVLQIMYNYSPGIQLPNYGYDTHFTKSKSPGNA